MPFLSKNLFLVSLICVLTYCASTIQRVEDVIDLAPPRHVTYTIDGDELLLKWQASTDESKPDFQGYNIYISTKSLVFGFLSDLPEPLQLDKNIHQFKIDKEQAASPCFVHIRSRNTKGHLSHPSLPELVIP